MNTREDYIAAMRNLLSWLEQHPDVPIHHCTTIRYSVLSGEDKAGMARLEEIGALIGADVEVTHGTHYDVERTFGPVTYQAGYISRAHMAAYEEHMKPFHEQCVGD